MTDADLAAVLRRRADETFYPLTLRNLFVEAAARVEDMMELTRYLSMLDIDRSNTDLVRHHFDQARARFQHEVGEDAGVVVIKLLRSLADGTPLDAALKTKYELEEGGRTWTRLVLESGAPIRLEHGAILSNGQRERAIGTYTFFPDGSVHRDHHL